MRFCDLMIFLCVLMPGAASCYSQDVVSRHGQLLVKREVSQLFEDWEVFAIN